MPFSLVESYQSHKTNGVMKKIIHHGFLMFCFLTFALTSSAQPSVLAETIVDSHRFEVIKIAQVSERLEAHILVTALESDSSLTIYRYSNPHRHTRIIDINGQTYFAQNVKLAGISSQTGSTTRTALTQGIRTLLVVEFSYAPEEPAPLQLLEIGIDGPSDKYMRVQFRDLTIES